MICAYLILKYSTKHSLWKECWHQVIFKHAFSSPNSSNQIGHSVWPYLAPTCLASTFSVPFKNTETLSSTTARWLSGQILLMTFMMMQHAKQREKIEANMHNTKTITMWTLNVRNEDLSELPLEYLSELPSSSLRKRFEFL